MSPNPAGKAAPEKAALRLTYAAGRESASGSPGILAQHLRSLPAYRTARQLFVSPAPLLKQIRINALVDGKSLLMPAPSLHDGFFLFVPFAVPFTHLPLAVTNKGMPRYGRKLTTAELAGLQIDLLVTDALVVDRQGVMLADGNGFFDLAAAILAVTGALAPGYLVVGAGPAPVADELLPVEPWDVRANHCLTIRGLAPCHSPGPVGPPLIHWQNLELVRIRRITPLWQMREPG